MARAEQRLETMTGLLSSIDHLVSAADLHGANLLVSFHAGGSPPQPSGSALERLESVDALGVWTSGIPNSGLSIVCWKKSKPAGIGMAQLAIL